jgi:hypothetical protein
LCLTVPEPYQAGRTVTDIAAEVVSRRLHFDDNATRRDT